MVNTQLQSGPLPQLGEFEWACRASDVLDVIKDRPGWQDQGIELEYIPSRPPCMAGKTTDRDDHLCHGTLVTSEVEVYPPEVDESCELSRMSELLPPEAELDRLSRLGNDHPEYVLREIELVESLRWQATTGPELHH